MNFYIGNEVDKIDVTGYNVLFEYYLTGFLYKYRDIIEYDTSILFDIDPFDDEVISNEDMPEIIDVCKHVLASPYLEEYDEVEEAKEMLNGLIEIAEKAFQMGVGLVSMGD